MKSKPKLLAAITASGAVLSLALSAHAHQASNHSELILGTETAPLSTRVEQLRKKLQAASPLLNGGSAEGRIDNVVQFFNFRNR
jgi:outer membrane murein-binding lipoprotein Lpp